MHTCAFVYKCICTHVPIFCLHFHILSHECVCMRVCLCVWISLTALFVLISRVQLSRGQCYSLSPPLALCLSLPPSLPLQVLTSVDCLWPLVLWMLSPAILPRCINNNSNYWPSNQSVAPARWACLGEQIDRHLKSHIDCREGEKHQGGWEDR